MARKIKKFYNTNPNEWINLLGKKGVRVYPVINDGHYVIAVDNGKDVKLGSKTYTESTYIYGWYVALEYLHNKLKQ